MANVYPNSFLSLVRLAKSQDYIVVACSSKLFASEQPPLVCIINERPVCTFSIFVMQEIGFRGIFLFDRLGV